MKTPYVTATITGSLWALLVVMGLSTVRGARSLPAHLAAAQANYYFYFPLAMLGLVIAAWLIGRYRAGRFIAYVVYALALLALPCYLLFYTGGM